MRLLRNICLSAQPPLLCQGGEFCLRSTLGNSPSRRGLTEYRRFAAAGNSLTPSETAPTAASSYSQRDSPMVRKPLRGHEDQSRDDEIEPQFVRESAGGQEG